MNPTLWNAIGLLVFVLLIVFIVLLIIGEVTL